MKTHTETDESYDSTWDEAWERKCDRVEATMARVIESLDTDAPPKPYSPFAMTVGIAMDDAALVVEAGKEWGYEISVETALLLNALLRMEDNTTDMVVALRDRNRKSLRPWSRSKAPA